MTFENQLNHNQYKKFVKDQLIQLFKTNEITSIINFDYLIARFFLFNLDYIRELLMATYNNPHNKPRDPASMIRSLLLMTSVKEPSITNWVNRLKNSKVYAILSGFKTDDLPGVGTFYDFIDRLTLAEKELKRKQRNRRKKFKRKPNKKLKKNEKLPLKHPQVVNKIVKRIMKNLNTPPYLSEYRLIYKFFIHSVVEHSAKLGLLGDPDNIFVSGDGTHIKTGASPYGRKDCNCPKFNLQNGKKVFNRCDCPRKFSDYFAAWGWDSYREQYVYGYAFYELTAASSPYDLPLFFLQAQASRHDSVMAPLCVDLLRKLLPQKYIITKFSADGAHDNIPTYKLMDTFNYEPFIPLNDRNKDNLTYQTCPINNLGIPVCRCGVPMVYNGYCPDRMRIKWRCPLKAKKNFKEKKQCIENNYCTTSEYGRVVYTYPKNNLRLFNKTPRGSEEWIKIYDKRTSSERSNKRKKIDYRIEQARVRSRKQWFVRYSLAAICQHLDAWEKTSDINFKELCLAWQNEALN
jgi:hypothetical protein